jgi:hypothetical protein
MNDPNSELDARLGAVLRGTERAPDEAFVTRVARAVEAEQRMEMQRRRAWQRLASEALAAAAVAAAFVLVGRLSPAAGKVDMISFAPATAAGLVLLLWMAVGMRPFATGR